MTVTTVIRRTMQTMQTMEIQQTIQVTQMTVTTVIRRTTQATLMMEIQPMTAVPHPKETTQAVIPDCHQAADRDHHSHSLSPSAKDRTHKTEEIPMTTSVMMVVPRLLPMSNVISAPHAQLAVAAVWVWETFVTNRNAEASVSVCSKTGYS